MPTTRLYKVIDAAGVGHLVDATSVAQARNHVASDQIKVSIAKPAEIVEMMTSGIKVEKAGAAPTETTET